MTASHDTAFSLFVAALGKKLGLDSAVPEDGVFRMVADGRPFSIIRQGDSATLYCAVGRLPEDAEKANAMRAVLLNANVLYQGTYGACLGAESGEGVVTLCYQTPMHSVTEEGFVGIAENFLNLADLWEKRLEDDAGQSADETEAEKPATQDSPWMRA